MRNTITITAFLLFFVLNAFGQSIHTSGAYVEFKKSKVKKTAEEDFPTRSS